VSEHEEPRELLAEREQDIITRLGEMWGDLCSIVEDGPTRDADLRELVVHVHALQHAVMAQAAARAYPTTYRRLGSSLRT
jgi:hypothetical protein